MTTPTLSLSRLLQALHSLYIRNKTTEINTVLSLLQGHQFLGQTIHRVHFIPLSTTADPHIELFNLNSRLIPIPSTVSLHPEATVPNHSIKLVAGKPHPLCGQERLTAPLLLYVGTDTQPLRIKFPLGARTPDKSPVLAYISHPLLPRKLTVLARPHAVEACFLRTKKEPVRNGNALLQRDWLVNEATAMCRARFTPYGLALRIGLPPIIAMLQDVKTTLWSMAAVDRSLTFRTDNNSLLNEEDKQNLHGLYPKKGSLLHPLAPLAILLGATVQTKNSLNPLQPEVFSTAFHNRSSLWQVRQAGEEDLHISHKLYSDYGAPTFGNVANETLLPLIHAYIPQPQDFLC